MKNTASSTRVEQADPRRVILFLNVFLRGSTVPPRRPRTKK
jgi:hypothetical protein